MKRKELIVYPCQGGHVLVDKKACISDGDLFLLNGHSYEWDGVEFGMETYENCEGKIIAVSKETNMMGAENLSLLTLTQFKTE